MKVGIIGAGSIGLLFASYLSRAFEVTIYTRTEEQAAEINKCGIVLLKGAGKTISFVNALPFTEWEGADALTIIAVKQYQLEPILEKFKILSLIPEKLLFLQNGMGHLKLLEQINARHLFVGTVEHGAQKENAFTVRHNGEGTTNIAVYAGNPISLREFVSAVPVEFSFEIKEDYYEMLINKLIVNAVVNTLTAVLGVQNGELINNTFYFQVLQNLFYEIAAVMNLKNKDEHLRQIIQICTKTAENRSSMLKDIEAGRLTEVDAILGFLLEEAGRLEWKTPMIENFYCLIKGKELAERGLCE